RLGDRRSLRKPHQAPGRRQGLGNALPRPRRHVRSSRRRVRRLAGVRARQGTARPRVRAMKTIAVLGATGSIGASALDVVARHPDRFRVGALAAHRNVAALAELCARFKPSLAVIADASLAGDLLDRLRAANLATRVAAGAEALIEAATEPSCDTVIAAIV